MLTNSKDQQRCNVLTLSLSPEIVSFRLLGPAKVSLAQLFSGFYHNYSLLGGYVIGFYMVSFLSSFHNPLSTLETKVPNF